MRLNDSCLCFLVYCNTVADGLLCRLAFCGVNVCFAFCQTLLGYAQAWGCSCMFVGC